jgi:deoxyhypusine synthase
MTRQDEYSYKPVEVANVDHLPKIKGYNFDKKFNFSEFFESYGSTGFQASNLVRAREVWHQMDKDKATVFLTFTSNMISSGVRESILYLVKHKKVQVLITSGGGVEEDIIKCLKPFVLGSFDTPGKILYSKGINRTGNIFVPNDRYLYFEKFFNPMMEKLYAKNKTIKAHDLTRELGKAIDDESSVLYWAYKNDIPVFCPAIIDGSIGDLIQFFRQRHPDFVLDVADDIVAIARIALNAEKTGVICLGSGTPKHFALNANIFREGAEYAIYINTGEEFDGSDSGANVDEAMTWAKVKTDAPNVKIHGDATIIFPLLVAATFFGGRGK